MNEIVGVSWQTMVISSVLAWLILIIPQWKIFEKAGEKGWKAIIPLYSEYIMYKISWKTSMFFIFIILLAAVSFCSALTGGLAVTIITWILCIPLAVLSIVSVYKISKAFGHGAGFAVGLLFLNVIFMYILAFDKSTYQGAQ